ncbi:DUF3795 domain-containing protein [bacterium]|nr:DUF3795 domain-containing protein [bacterium]
MAELIAVCGLDCGQCEAYIATVNDDDEARAKVAAKWAEAFNPEIKATDINCNGCTSKEGVHFGYCSMCKIRLCGLDRGLDNCAYCDDYACEILEGIFKMAPHAKTKLEAIRAGLW